MTAQTDPLAPLRGRGKYRAIHIPGQDDWWVGDENGSIAADHDEEDEIAVAHALNLALSADALLAERDATIARLEARIANMRTDLAQVIATTDAAKTMSALYEDVRLVCRVGLDEDDRAASGGEGGE